MEFSSIRQREVGEEISVLIFLTNICRSIDFKSLYIKRFHLIFVNFRSIIIILLLLLNSLLTTKHHMFIGII